MVISAKELKDKLSHAIAEHPYLSRGMMLGGPGPNLLAIPSAVAHEGSLHNQYTDEEREKLPFMVRHPYLSAMPTEIAGIAAGAYALPRMVSPAMVMKAMQYGIPPGQISAIGAMLGGALGTIPASYMYGKAKEKADAQFGKSGEMKKIISGKGTALAVAPDGKKFDDKNVNNEGALMNSVTKTGADSAYNAGFEAGLQKMAQGYGYLPNQNANEAPKRALQAAGRWVGGAVQGVKNWGKAHGWGRGMPTGPVQSQPGQNLLAYKNHQAPAQVAQTPAPAATPAPRPSSTAMVDSYHKWKQQQGGWEQRQLAADQARAKPPVQLAQQQPQQPQIKTSEDAYTAGYNDMMAKLARFAPGLFTRSGGELAGYMNNFNKAAPRVEQAVSRSAAPRPQAPAAKPVAPGRKYILRSGSGKVVSKVPPAAPTQSSIMSGALNKAMQSGAPKVAPSAGTAVAEGEKLIKTPSQVMDDALKAQMGAEGAATGGTSTPWLEEARKKLVSMYQANPLLATAALGGGGYAFGNMGNNSGSMSNMHGSDPYAMYA